jgi:hypothetical protein
MGKDGWELSKDCSAAILLSLDLQVLPRLVPKFQEKSKKKKSAA